MLPKANEWTRTRRGIGTTKEWRSAYFTRRIHGNKWTCDPSRWTEPPGAPHRRRVKSRARLPPTRRSRRELASVESQTAMTSLTEALGSRYTPRSPLVRIWSRKRMRTRCSRNPPGVLMSTTSPTRGAPRDGRRLICEPSPRAGSMQVPETVSRAPSG